MGWLSILKLLLGLTNAIAEIVKEKQLMDAGSALALLENNNVHIKKINDALTARNNVDHSTDAVRNDPDNTDNY